MLAGDGRTATDAIITSFVCVPAGTLIDSVVES